MLLFAGHVTNTDTEEAKCCSCDADIGMKMLRVNLPPNRILSVPKLSIRKRESDTLPHDQKPSG